MAQQASTQNDAQTSQSLTFSPHDVTKSHTDMRDQKNINSHHQHNYSKPKSLHRTKTDPRGGRPHRKKKRSKKEEKKWKKKMKEIGKNHPEFELSYDLLLGIRTSTSTVISSVIRSSVAPEDEDDSSEDEEYVSIV